MLLCFIEHKFANRGAYGKRSIVRGFTFTVGAVFIITRENREVMLIEQTTDLWSFNTGRVQAKLRVNEKPFPEKTDLKSALIDLREKYGCERLTIQSGGTVNGMFLREKLFDYVDIVVAPVLIGGKDTSTLIDGKSLLKQEELDSLGVLKLEECTVLEDSYIRIRYKVIS